MEPRSQGYGGLFGSMFLGGDGNREVRMTRLLPCFAAAVMSLFFAAVGWAVPTTITDSIFFSDDGFTCDPATPPDTLDAWGGQSVKWLEYGSDQLDWTHKFAFDPPLAKVISGSFSILIKDDEDDTEAQEWGIIAAEDWFEPGGPLLYGEINTGAYVCGITASYLEDGSYQVGVTSLFGDFMVEESTLRITYEPVPEASTLMLFGSGLPGLAVWARSRRRKIRT